MTLGASTHRRWALIVACRGPRHRSNVCRLRHKWPSVVVDWLFRRCRRSGDRGGRAAPDAEDAISTPTCVGRATTLGRARHKWPWRSRPSGCFTHAWSGTRGPLGCCGECGGEASLWYRTSRRGAWRSLVAHPAGGRAVGGSNPLAPTDVEGKPRTTRLRWLPNAITSLRLAALPVLIWFLAVDPGPTSTRAAWFFGAIGATDFIDGQLARRLGAESKFGAIADPFADRMLMAVGLIGLITLDRYSWPGPTIILARDVIAVFAFVILARRGVALQRRYRPGRSAPAWRCSPLGWRS